MTPSSASSTELVKQIAEDSGQRQPCAAASLPRGAQHGRRECADKRGHSDPRRLGDDRLHSRVAEECRGRPGHRSHSGHSQRENGWRRRPPSHNKPPLRAFVDQQHSKPASKSGQVGSLAVAAGSIDCQARHLESSTAKRKKELLEGSRADGGCGHVELDRSPSSGDCKSSDSPEERQRSGRWRSPRPDRGAQTHRRHKQVDVSHLPGDVDRQRGGQGRPSRGNQARGNQKSQRWSDHNRTQPHNSQCEPTDKPTASMDQLPANNDKRLSAAEVQHTDVGCCAHDGQSGRPPPGFGRPVAGAAPPQHAPIGEAGDQPQRDRFEKKEHCRPPPGFSKKPESSEHS